MWIGFRSRWASCFLLGVAALTAACGDDTGPAGGNGGGGGSDAATTTASTAETTSSTTGTGGGDGGHGGAGGAAACDALTDEGCEAGEVCEEVQGGTTGCFAPIAVVGRVFDYFTDDAIEGARVVARDVNGAAVSGVATSAADGRYELRVPAMRDANGDVAADPITLRVDAADFEAFPTPPRSALPIDLGTAAPGEPGEPDVVENAATDVGLIGLPDTDGLGTVSGSVDLTPLADAPSPAGMLILAGSATGIADLDGTFVVFNVPSGTVDVSGYLAGVNVEPTTADVVADEETTGVVLTALEDETASVSGSVQIVNGNGFDETSVILALEDTFDETAIRFDAPAGLRAGSVSGAFTIEGVPDGRYVVLAGFENDGLVRDPDISIGGTEILHIEVAGEDVSIAEGFKITGALAVIGPGADAIETTTATPTFVFEDDSSEDEYDVVVRDAFGTLIWETTVDGVSGNQDVEVPYAGPALVPGFLYQFKATSVKDGTPISTTEDLRGVFEVEGEPGGAGGAGGGDGGAGGSL